MCIRDRLCHAPGLVVPFLLAKYAPHRDAMEAEWAKLAAHAPTDPVQLTYRVLTRTLQKLHKRPLKQVCIDNVGRRTTHHGGLIPFANKSLSVRRPVGLQTRSAPGVLSLGQRGRPSRLQELTGPLG